MNFRCVIFDLDGTLLNTLGDIAASLNRALAQKGYPGHNEKEVVNFVNDGAAKLIERALPEAAREERIVKDVLERYIGLYHENLCEKTYAYDGLARLCRKLSERGVLLGVVSNKPDPHVKALARMFFGEDFSYLSGTGRGLPIKPDPLCVTRALDFFGAEKGSCLFVGDSHVDVRTARAAGVTCAGVAWGFGGIAGFREHQPDFVITNPAELEHLILGGTISCETNL